MKKPSETPTARSSFLLNTLKRLRRESSGVALIEAAIALPIMIVVMMGVVTYSFWLLTAQSLQQVANDAARSSLGGLTEVEREALAKTSIENSLLQAANVDPELVTVKTVEEDGYLTITLTYDGSADPVFSSSIIPIPSKSISRSSAIEIADI